MSRSGGSKSGSGRPRIRSSRSRRSRGISGHPRRISKVDAHLQSNTIRPARLSHARDFSQSAWRTALEDSVTPEADDEGASERERERDCD